MNFDFSDDQKSLAEQVRRYLEKNCSSEKIRAILDGTEPFDRGLYTGLAEMGVLGAAIPEEFGGTGLGHLELCLFAEELGRALAPVPIFSTIYLVAELLKMAGTEEQKQCWLPHIASGETVACFGLAEQNGRVTPNGIGLRESDGRLNGTKWPVAYGDCADIAIVAARTGEQGADEDDISLYLVDLHQTGVTREICESIDPTRSFARLNFDYASAEVIGEKGAGWSLAGRVFDRAAILVAFEQLGGADKSLEMARDYALERMAFGRQIGSFQAIKHMLADMYAAAAFARSNAFYGAYALSTDASDIGFAAATARISSTQAYQQCASNNIQVHGGMGFTWEYDCHVHYRRSNSLALALGSQTTWEDKLVGHMSASNRIAA